MINFKTGDKVQVLYFNSTEEWGLVGRKGTITELSEEGENGDSDMNLYYVNIDGDDIISGEWLLAERELEIAY